MTSTTWFLRYLCRLSPSLIVAVSRLRVAEAGRGAPHAEEAPSPLPEPPIAATVWPPAGPDQFWAPPMPRRASVTFGGFSMICEKRTTVTVSSIDTGRA